jgi:hypothetical protein
LFPKIAAGLPWSQPDPGNATGWEILIDPKTGLPYPLFGDRTGTGQGWQEIAQGSYGDCGTLATLIGIVDADPNWPQEHVWMNPNGTVTVKLYDHKGNPIEVTVSGELPSRNGVGGAGSSPKSPNNANVNGTWAAYVEKAMAQYDRKGSGTPPGTYADIEGRWPQDVIPALTGKKGVSISSASGVATAVSNGQGVMIYSGEDQKMGVTATGSDRNLYGPHEYAVTNTRTDKSGQNEFFVANPWGKDHPGWVTQKELETFFSTYTGIPK